MGHSFTYLWGPGTLEGPGRQEQRFDVSRGPKDYRNIRISQSGSKAQ